MKTLYNAVVQKASLQKKIAIGAGAALLWVAVAGGWGLIDQHNKDQQLDQVQTLIQTLQSNRIDPVLFATWQQKNMEAIKVQTLVNQKKAAGLNPNDPFVKQAGLSGEVQQTLNTIALEQANALQRIHKDQDLVRRAQLKLDEAYQFEEQVKNSKLNPGSSYPELPANLASALNGDADATQAAEDLHCRTLQKAMRDSTPFYAQPLVALGQRIDLQIQEIRDYQAVVTSGAHAFHKAPDRALIEKTGAQLLAQYDQQRKKDLAAWNEHMDDEGEMDDDEKASFEKERAAAIQNINQVYDAAQKQVKSDEQTLLTAFVGQGAASATPGVAQDVPQGSPTTPQGGGAQGGWGDNGANANANNGFFTDILLYHWLMNSGGSSYYYSPTRQYAGNNGAASQSQDKKKDQNTPVVASMGHGGGVVGLHPASPASRASAFPNNPYLAPTRLAQMYDVHNPSSLMGQRLTTYSQVHGVKALAFHSFAKSQFSRSSWVSRGAAASRSSSSMGRSFGGGSHGSMGG